MFVAAQLCGQRRQIGALTISPILVFCDSLILPDLAFLTLPQERKACQVSGALHFVL